MHFNIWGGILSQTGWRPPALLRIINLKGRWILSNVWFKHLIMSCTLCTQNCFCVTYWALWTWGIACIKYWQSFCCGTLSSCVWRTGLIHCYLWKRGLAAEPNLLEGYAWSDIGLCSDPEQITDGRRAQESVFTPVFQPDCSSDHDHCCRLLLTATKMSWKCDLFY